MENTSKKMSIAEAGIANILENGETMRWSGVSDEFPLLTPDYKKHALRTWGVCGVILAVVFLAMFMWVGLTDGLVKGLLLLGVILAVVCFQPISDRKRILAQNAYFLTDRRAIVYADEREIYDFNLYGTEAEFVPAGQGHIHLVLRGEGSKKSDNYRLIAWRPFRDSEGGQAVTDMVFYNIPDSRELRSMFED